MRTIVAFCIPLAVLAPGPASGQGLSDVPLTRVESVADAEDDRLVTLRGHIVSEKGEDSYLFSDGTGEILVKVRDPNVGRLAPGTSVELRGEVEAQAFRAPQIEAGTVIVTPEKGPDINPGRGHRPP